MSDILKRIVANKHYKFIDEPVTWQEAVRLSTESLIADGCVTEEYYQQIVDCIEKYGPYVVFDHYVAMPHSTENATGVLKTSVGFMVSKQIVDFGEDEDGEKKEAKLFFTLASCDGNQHMDNITQLMSVFMNEPLLDALMEANTPEDILAAVEKYPCEEE